MILRFCLLFNRIRSPVAVCEFRIADSGFRCLPGLLPIDLNPAETTARLSGIVKKKKAGVAWHKVVVGIVSIIGAASYGSVLVHMMDRSLLAAPNVKMAAIGFVTGALFWVVFGRKLGFFGVFEHEFAHLVMGLLMFQKPEAFFATAKRGHVRVGGKNFLVDLAPYYFPTFSLILLVVFPLLKPSAQPYFYPVLGFVTGYHLVSQISDFKFYQGDIRVSGRLFSIVFCAFASVLAFGFIFAFVVGGYRGGWHFLQDGVREAWHVLALGWRHLRSLAAYLRERGTGAPSPAE